MLRGIPMIKVNRYFHPDYDQNLSLYHCGDYWMVGFSNTIKFLSDHGIRRLMDRMGKGWELL